LLFAPVVLARSDQNSLILGMSLIGLAGYDIPAIRNAEDLPQITTRLSCM